MLTILSGRHGSWLIYPFAALWSFPYKLINRSKDALPGSLPVQVASIQQFIASLSGHNGGIFAVAIN